MSSVPATVLPMPTQLPAGMNQPGNQLWADNKLLVIGTTYQLPARCLKTNVSNDLELEKVTIHYSFSEKVVLRAPFNARYLRRRQLHFVLSPITILCGALVFAFGLFLTINADGDEVLGALALPVTGLGFLILIGGFIYWVGSQSALLRKGKKVGEHAWIDGVSPKYLAELPKWNGPASTPGPMPASTTPSDMFRDPSNTSSRSPMIVADQANNPYASPTFVDEPTANSAAAGTIASRTRRWINWFIDNLILQMLSYAAGLSLGLFFVQSNGGRLNQQDLSLLRILAFFLGLLVAFLYYFLLEVVCQKTVGKMVTRTKVTALDGGRASVLQILGRTAARFIPLEALTFLGSEEPRGWHDSLSGTRVIRE